VAVCKETRSGERRVAAVPATVELLRAAGFTVAVQPGAGIAAGVGDQAFAAAGAELVDDPLTDATVLLAVAPPSPETLGRLKAGTLVISFAPWPAARASVAAASAAGVTWLAVERIPRISRAQSMDALTSQALVAGYRAALIAAEAAPRFFPMLMTAAGTIQPARVLVLGAGVAGLQAIATAKRLGARVSAYDVRPSSADEVRSMGATFLDLGLESMEGSGGYAREMTPERAAAQQAALATHIAAADVLITTAAVPNRPAPLLVTAEMLDGMKPGAVVVDLAAESGGNVAGSVAGQRVERGGVTVIGMADAASQLAEHASALYARNLAELLQLCLRDGRVDPDPDDEIIAGASITRDGLTLVEEGS
jgi:NAD(P) transhydrogenase subunit alpha